MKKNFKKFILHSLSVALSLFMLSNFALSAILSEDRIQKKYITVAAAQPTMAQSTVMPNVPVSASLLTGKTEKQYVKDVKFITGDSLADAKKNVPAGYILVETDLNQGAAYITAVDDVYLAYTTTTNPDEAITDIKMMNMKGGFVVSDYDTQINNVNENIKNMASEFSDAVDVFVENYKKGTSGAKAAYKTLSAFTIDELDNKTLADYFVYSDVPDTFYIKLILNAHTDILSSILSALTMAVQGEPGNTWLDRLAEIEDPYEVTNSIYWDQAVALLPHFESFFDAYDSIDHDLFRGPGGPLYAPPDDEGNRGDPLTQGGKDSNLDLTGGEFFYELAHMWLEQYEFGDGTLVSDLLVDYYPIEESLYPLIEVLTPAEYAMMHLCGPLYMIFATAMSDDVYLDYAQRADDIIAESGKCSVWAGVNTDLLRSSIGITDEACRAIVETEAEQEFNNQGDSAMDTALKTAGLFAAAGAVALGVGMLTVMITGSSLFAGLLGTAAVAFTCKAAIVTSIAGVVCGTAGVVGIVIALVMVVVYLVVWLIDWIAGFYPELTDIPEYMYDYVIDDSDNAQFLLYEAAKDQNGNPVDVNAFDGQEWHAPYISRDKAAGAPIEADFIVRTGDGRLDEGYGALSAFGNVNCENLNRYAFADDVNGVFVSYRQEDLTGDYARGKYISDMRLFTAENEEQCKLEIKNKNYSLYNVNLTPDADYCTYIGYKMTNKESNALTDIRFAYNYNSTQYSAGGGNLTYAASGTAGPLTLYTTRISVFGSPITSNFTVVSDRKDAPIGYEPVNMFSGGDAISLNIDDDKQLDENKPYYLYFLPSKAYVSGTEYLGGIATIFDTPEKGTYTTKGNVGSVDRAIEKLGYKKLASMNCEDSDNMEGAIIYSTTYNPYRAIYDIGAMKNGGEWGKYFSETITYESLGYMLAARYVILDTKDEAEKIQFDSKIRDDDSRLYVAGARANGKPMTMSDIVASENQDVVPEGFKSVNAFLGNDARAVDLSKGFNYRYSVSHKRNVYMTMSPIYLYIRGTAYQEGQYLSSVSIVSKEQLTGGQDIDCGDIDKSYVMNSLASQGVHTVIDKNLNLADGTNATFLGYTKDAKVKDPITDMILYYAGNTDAEPNPKYTKNGIVYHLVSDANIFCEENYDKKTCKRVYLYQTTNPAAGAPIMDIKIDNTIIVDGWQTVRTQNGKALYDDMGEYSGSMWFIHMKRAGEEPKYIGEIVVGWGSDAKAKAMLLEAGCDYMLQKDFNNNVGAHSDYVYLGYKRTNDPNKAIRNIISVHDEDYTTFTKSGATYYKIEGNLNSYTNIFADDIYLFYTKDEKGGTPITSLGTSGSVANWSHGEGNRYVVKTVLNQNGKASDLNKGCGYQSDYIYLLITRDKMDQGLVASMIGEGSVLIIITFAAVSACVVESLYIIKKKREGKERNDAGAQANSEE